MLHALAKMDGPVFVETYSELWQDFWVQTGSEKQNHIFRILLELWYYLTKECRRPDTSSWFDPHEAQSLVVEYTVKRHCTQKTNWGFYYILMLSSGVLFLVQELSLEL